MQVQHGMPTILLLFFSYTEHVLVYCNASLAASFRLMADGRPTSTDFVADPFALTQCCCRTYTSRWTRISNSTPSVCCRFQSISLSMLIYCQACIQDALAQHEAWGTRHMHGRPSARTSCMCR